MTVMLTFLACTVYVAALIWFIAWWSRQHTQTGRRECAQCGARLAPTPPGLPRADFCPAHAWRGQ